MNDISRFMYVGNWFERKYKEKLNDGGNRYTSMHIALCLFLQFGKNIIIETGTTRAKDDYGAGYSTYIFGEVCSCYDRKLVTIDNSYVHLEQSKDITQEFSSNIQYCLSDSVSYLSSIDNWDEIGLIYLDSFDYPDGEMITHYGNVINETDATTIWDALLVLPDEIVEQTYGNILNRCQQHQLLEFMAFKDKINSGTILLLDDNDLPGGGKTRLLKNYLVSTNQWICIIDSRQSLWIRR